MERDQFAKYFKERYENQLNWIDRKAVALKRTYTRMQIWAIVFASLTTVLAAAGTVAGEDVPCLVEIRSSPTSL